MRKLLVLISVCSSFISAQVSGQFREKDVDRYIETYKDLAIAEQIKNKIPASIKLAQGIYETAAGTSELANNARNHFGIKCKSTWQGQTYTYDDDRKNECFRMYSSHAESYMDHSYFLKGNPRYAPLFELSVLDYKGWARQLKKSGYATNPSYSEKLIDIVERYNLNQYTELALYTNSQSSELIAAAEDKNLYMAAYKSTSPAAPPVRATVVAQAEEEPGKDYYREMYLHGIKGFYARKGDMLLEYAIKYKVRYATLLYYNDLKDEPLPYDMFIYLDTKKKTGDRPHVVVGKNQTLHAIAQAEGIQLEQLRNLNKLENGDEPAEGETINLQTAARTRPELRIVQLPNVNLKSRDQPDDFITKTAISQPANTSLNDGVVKIVDEDNFDKTQYSDSDEEEEDEAAYTEATDPNDEVVEPEEAPEVVEAPVKNQTNFRIVETADNKSQLANTTPTSKGSNPAEQKDVANSELDKLKKRMDRSVYSDGDALPVRKTEYEAGVAKVNNNVAGTKFENKVPPPNSELNRTAKQHTIDKTKRKNGKTDLNIAFKEHMKKVTSGLYPAYYPKATGVGHTTFVAPAAPAPKKVAVKKTNSKNSKTAKNTKTDRKSKPVARNDKKSKNTNAVAANKKADTKNKKKQTAQKITKPPVKKKK